MRISREGPLPPLLPPAKDGPQRGEVDGPGQVLFKVRAFHFRSSCPSHLSKIVRWFWSRVVPATSEATPACGSRNAVSPRWFTTTCPRAMTRRSGGVRSNGGDVRDTGRLAAVIAAWTPVGAIHFAALIDVAGSQTRTAAFYDVNVTGVISVLSALTAAGIAPFVFSSTCATYGNPIAVPIDESHPQARSTPTAAPSSSRNRRSRISRATRGCRR